MYMTFSLLIWLIYGDDVKENALLNIKSDKIRLMLILKKYSSLFPLNIKLFI